MQNAKQEMKMDFSEGTASGTGMARPVKRLRVLLLDLWPTVPYYSGSLAAALKETNRVGVILGCATYTHDRTFFRRVGLRNNLGLLDIAYRVPWQFLRRALKFSEYLCNLGILAARLMRQRPDVIHVQFTPLFEHNLRFEFWFLKAAKKQGSRLVYSVHNVLPHEDGSRHRVAYRKLYRIMDQFICHDVTSKDRLIHEFGIDPKRISIIPHGPIFSHSASRDETVSRERPTRTKCVVLWQGIIRPYKGVSLLLEAWKIAQQGGLNGILKIVGTGEAKELVRIKEQVRSLGVESSVCLDLRFVSVEELAEYYEAADIVAYPYRDITTSGALMTGIGYGKALIASDLPAFRQVLQHDKNAILIPRNDVIAWANALLLLASNDELRNRLARQLSRDHSALKTWNEIAAETLNVYSRR
jgi:glycosyltransferase involved in cell wall biosynthesis